MKSIAEEIEYRKIKRKEQEEKCLKCVYIKHCGGDNYFCSFDYRNCIKK